jgi:hypothetical protein
VQRLRDGQGRVAELARHASGSAAALRLPPSQQPSNGAAPATLLLNTALIVEAVAAAPRAHRHSTSCKAYLARDTEGRWLHVVTTSTRSGETALRVADMTSVLAGMTRCHPQSAAACEGHELFNLNATTSMYVVFHCTSNHKQPSAYAPRLPELLPGCITVYLCLTCPAMLTIPAWSRNVCFGTLCEAAS